MRKCVELSGEDLTNIAGDPSWRPDYTTLLERDPELANAVTSCRLLPGDYMLWSDRLIHGNSPGRGPSPTGANLARASVFLSMSPMSLLDEETREARRQMALIGMMGGHGSHHVPPAPVLAEAVAVGPDGKETVLERDLTPHQKAMIPM